MVIGKLTLRDQLKARKIVRCILASSTETLLNARKTLVREGDKVSIEMIDHVLKQRGITSF